MTVIAFKDGVMAADSQMTMGGGTRVPIPNNKLNRVGDLIVGSCGNHSEGRLFLKWLQDRSISYPSLSEGFQALVMGEDTIELYDWKGFCLAPPSPYALGTGYELALGAMEAGADVKRAVEIAIKYDVSCGYPINTMTLKIQPEDKDNG